MGVRIDDRSRPGRSDPLAHVDSAGEPDPEPFVVSEPWMHDLHRHPPLVRALTQVHLPRPVGSEATQQPERPDPWWVVAMQRLHLSEDVLSSRRSVRHKIEV